MINAANERTSGLPDEWRSGNIAEYFNVITGTTPPTKEAKFWNNGTVQWFTPADLSKLNGSVYTKKSERRISHDGFKYSNLETVPKGSIIISTRAPVGSIAIASGPSTFNQGCKGLVPKDPQATETGFYYYYLLFNRENLEKKSSGSTFKELSKDLLEQFSVPRPPLLEQRRIATILTTVDDAIQRSRQAAAETERIKAGVMHELMTKGIGHTEFKENPDVGKVPKAWDIVTLSDVMNQRSEIMQPSPKLKEKFVGLEHIETGESTLKKYDLNADLKSTKSRFYRGDILYGKLRPYLDKAAISGFEGICSTDLLVLTPRQEKSTADFLINILHSHDFIQYTISTTSGTNHPRTSWKAISEFRLGLPALTEQKQIATIFNSIDHKLSLQRQRTAHYEHLKQGLMNELLTGRRRVQVT